MVKQIINNQIERISHKENNIFWILFSIFVFTILTYGFLLNRIMTNTVAKQNMEKEMIALNADVNSLEFQYLNLKNGVTMELAKSRGFVSILSDKFAVIDSSKKNISLSINEN